MSGAGGKLTALIEWGGVRPEEMLSLTELFRKARWMIVDALAQTERNQNAWT
jgi:hypothetical protein